MGLLQTIGGARRSAALEPAIIVALALLCYWHGSIGITDMLLATILAELIHTRERGS